MKFRSLGILAALCMAMSVYAADKKTPEKPKEPETEAAAEATGAPSFNNTWALNGSYALDNLKGKIVVLFFYESG